jgi:3-oxoacyl-[acyl-carrier-protein] synthase-3
MAFEIIGTGRAVPSRRVSNDELAKELAEKISTSDEWIRSHTGIGARYMADDDCTTSDLALEAAKKALAKAAGLEGLPAAEAEKGLADAALSLDMIVLATASPDYYGSPATACIVQEKLGAKNAGAMDLGAGCTGFIYALETAAGLLSVGDRKRIMVIGSEVLTKFANWNDRASCVLFGDGAAAVLLEKTSAPTEGKDKRGIIRTILKADGSGAKHIVFRGGGTAEPFKEGENNKPIHIELNGQAVYNFAVKAMTDTISDIIAQEGISVNDLAYIIPHQANARIVQAAVKRLKIPEEICIINIEEYANTSAASIPIALDELNRGGKLKTGDIILTVGFGSGLTYGANLIVW